jgi:hypothetical protein
MENGYYWISRKDEVSEIAFYSDKTKLFYRIGTGYGLSINEVEVYNRVEGQNGSTSESGLHLAGVNGSLPVKCIAVDDKGEYGHTTMSIDYAGETITALGKKVKAFEIFIDEFNENYR